MNLPETLVLDITQDVIKRSEPRSCDRCAISVAVQDALGCYVRSSNFVRVFPHLKRYGEYKSDIGRAEAQAEYYELGKDGRLFMLDFDTYTKIQPTTLRLQRVPAEKVEVLRKGGHCY